MSIPSSNTPTASMHKKHIQSLSVIIPTRNSMGMLPKHVEALNEWIDLADEIIVVDSESSDGTVNFLKDNLRHSSIRFFNHPVGLYESWNFAIQQIKTEYTYIATVGDRIPLKSIKRLHTEALQTDADLIISPPTLYSTKGEASDANWPINQYLNQSNTPHNHRITPDEVMLWNVISLPGTLMGSSASNIYRTSALVNCPFPTNCGHAGDSAWALKNSAHLSWHIIPDLDSEFLKHGSGKKTRDTSHRKRKELYELAHSTLENTSITETNSDLQKILHALIDALKEKECAVVSFNKFRSERSLWHLHPKGWILRHRKNKGAAKIASLKGRAIKAFYFKDT